MNYNLICAELMGQGQDLSLTKSGNKYYISLTRGGFKYEGTEHENVPFASACSGNFDNYETAFAAFSCLLGEFGQGNYGFDDRAFMVRDCAAEKGGISYDND